MPEEIPTTGSEVHRREDGGVRWRAAAWAVWLLPLLVITILVVARPEKRTVTPVYHNAAQRWLQREALYDGPWGRNYYYFPQFAVLFVPFHLPPRVVGDILWRGTAAAGLAIGVWLFCGAISAADRQRAFVLVTLVALPLSLAALQNGQANAHFGATLLLAAGCLKVRRWWAAALFLCAATAIKPLGIAALGLAWATYPQLRWRLAVALSILAAFPFLFGPPRYVWSQYVASLDNLRQGLEMTEHRFADLNGLLRTFGIALTGKASLAMRASAGILMTGFCWTVARREAEPMRSLVWLSITAGYLMLFNPMTEANSYVILAPVLALMALRFLSVGKKRLSWLVAGMALTMGLLPNLLRPLLGNYFALFWHPTMTLIFLSVITWQLLGIGDSRPDPSRAAVGPK
jgi:alpha-1,2-mannosyltransferase